MSARDTVAAGTLRPIERAVRLFDPLGGGLPVRELYDANADRDVRAGNEVGILHQSAEVLRHRQCVGEACARQEQDEFFAAGAEERVNFAHPLSYERDQRLEDPVAFGVAEGVVDVLEAIDIEHQERRAFTQSAATLDRGGEHGVHLTPVECAGQRIGDRLLFEGAHTPLQDGDPDRGGDRDGQEEQIGGHRRNRSERPRQAGVERTTVKPER